VAPWLGYVTLVAACLVAFRLLYLRLEYRYFWINAWVEVLVFALIVLAHLVVRPRADPRFRQVANRVVLVTLLVMGLFLVIAFNIRIA
jgi:phosphatidylserine synthase